MRQQFEAVRSSRESSFLKAFNHIAKAIDDIYKDLTQVEGVPLGGTQLAQTPRQTAPELGFSAPSGRNWQLWAARESP